MPRAARPATDTGVSPTNGRTRLPRAARPCTDTGVSSTNGRTRLPRAAASVTHSTGRSRTRLPRAASSSALASATVATPTLSRCTTSFLRASRVRQKRRNRGLLALLTHAALPHDVVTRHVSKQRRESKLGKCGTHARSRAASKQAQHHSMKFACILRMSSPTVFLILVW